MFSPIQPPIQMGTLSPSQRKLARSLTFQTHDPSFLESIDLEEISLDDAAVVLRALELDRWAQAKVGEYAGRPKARILSYYLGSNLTGAYFIREAALCPIYIEWRR